MSHNAMLSEREPYPVRVGDYIIYCEKFKAAGVRNFSEKSTVSGDTIYSNTNKRALKLTFEGRVYEQSEPMRMLIRTDNFLASDAVVSVEYRGAFFKNCRLQSFTAEDRGDDYLYCAVTFVTAERTSASEVN